jgi:hypothetical protein
MNLFDLHQIFDFCAFSKSSSNSYKFAAINFETEDIQNYDDGTFSYFPILNLIDLFVLVSLLPNISQVIQHEKDADTVLICQGSKMKHTFNKNKKLSVYLFRSYQYC